MLGVLGGCSCSHSGFIKEGFVEEAWAGRLASPDVLVMFFRRTLNLPLLRIILTVIWFEVLLP